jgi:hypothetical protein
MFRRKKFFVVLFILFLLGQIALVVILGLNSHRAGKFDISFDTGGGTPINSLSVQEGTTFKEVQDQAITLKPFHLFLGWYSDEDHRYLYDIDSPIHTNITLYAAWTPDPSFTFYTITWINEDGSVLRVDPLVPSGSLPHYGSTPTKADSPQYSYSFTNWSPQITAAVADATYTANYLPVEKEFTVIWLSEGLPLEIDEHVHFGDSAFYDGPTPTKASDAQYTYEFIGWDVPLALVTSNQTYSASFQPHLRSYAVEFKSDSTTLYATTVAYGTTPVYVGATPTKAADAQNEYEFNAWSPSLGPIYGATIFQATFSIVKIKYNVTWINYDSSVLATSLIEYGNIPSYTGTTPTKPADANFTYTFASWSPTITSVVADITYQATYSSIVNTYDITFKNYDNSTLLIYDNIPYGTTLTYNGVLPTKASTLENSYSFSGWYPTLSAGDVVVSDATYVAQFTTLARNYVITWLNYNAGGGSTTTQVAYNTLPVAPSITLPTNSAQYSYSLGSWSPTIVVVSQDATYTYTPQRTLNTYTVSWLNWDNSSLEVDLEVAYGSTPSFDGTTPTRTSSAQWDYTFDHFSPQVAAVVGNVSYTATYSQVIRTYTITFQTDATHVFLTYLNIPYGTTLTYNGVEPQKIEYGYTYTFTGTWSPALAVGATVSGNQVYTAIFDETPNNYSVTWVNWDNTVLESESVAYNSLASFDGSAPTRATTAEYTYTFSGWDHGFVAGTSLVTYDIVYTAQYTSTIRQYTITWAGYYSEILNYGLLPSFAGAITLPDDNEYFTYSLGAWSPNIAIVTGNITYTYVPTATPITHSVTWYLSTGVVLLTYANVIHGSSVDYFGATPSLGAGYTFLGWGTFDGATMAETSPFMITEDTSFWAVFEQEILYHVLFKYHSTLLYERYVSSLNGSVSVPDPEAPDYYYFSHWSEDINVITSDLVVYAIYVSVFTFVYSGTNATITGYNPVRGYTNLTIPAHINVVNGATDTVYNVVAIDADTFVDTGANITNLTILNNVTTIYSGALNGLGNLISLTTPFVGTDINQNSEYGTLYSMFGTVNSYDSSIEIAGHYLPTSFTTIVITDAVKIAISALAYCVNITSVTLPETLLSIYEHAFKFTSITSLVIPDSVTSIDDYAFMGNDSLTTVFLGNNLEYIGTFAFAYSDILSSVYFGNSIEIIDEAAFYGTVLTSVTLPNSLIDLGTGAFRDITTLTSAYLGTGLQVIGERAFAGTGLTSIIIPGNVNMISNRAFEDCLSLIDVIVDDGVVELGDYVFSNCIFTSITLPTTMIAVGSYIFNGVNLASVNIPFVGNRRDDTGTSTAFGIIFNYDGDANHYIANSYFIPNSLTTVIITADNNIIADAFVGCSSITSIALANSITEIGAAAFANCTGLIGVVFGNNLVSIGAYAFMNCTSLKSLYLPNNLTTLGEYAFMQNYALKTLHIGNSLQTISEGAFIDSIVLASVVIPNNIVTIADYAFMGSSLLGTVQLGTSVETIGEQAFANDVSLLNITLPNSVRTIGWAAFQNDITLTSFNIPDGVTSINNSILKGASSIESVTSPIITNLISDSNSFASIFGPVSYAGAYYDTYSYYIPTTLSAITITSGTDLPAYAFAGLSSVVSIDLPSTLISVQTGAFENCSGLNSLNLDLGNVISISAGALGGCANLLSLAVPFVGTNESDLFASIFANNGNTDSSYFYSIYDYSLGAGDYLPNSLTEVFVGNTHSSIPEMGFASCVLITTIVISEGITNIGPYAFSDLTFMTSFNIPSTVTAIGQYAFTFSGLTFIEIPSSVLSVGQYAFSYCLYLTSVVLNEGLDYLEEGVFMNCVALTSLVVPNSVTFIGSFLVDRANHLESLTIPFIGNVITHTFGNASQEELGTLFGTSMDDNLYMTSKGYYIPYSLTTLIVTSDIDVLGSAVQEFVSLETVILNEGITWIGGDAFKGCTNLVTIVSPTTINYIGDGSFKGCTSLRYFPTYDGLQAIGDGAFEGCINLLSIVIPESVNTIGSRAFLQCYALTSVIFPLHHYYTIGSRAFESLHSLTTITLNNTAYLADGQFADCTALKTAYISTQTVGIATNAFANNSGLHVYSNYTSQPSQWLFSNVYFHFGAW